MGWLDIMYWGVRVVAGVRVGDGVRVVAGVRVGDWVGEVIRVFVVRGVVVVVLENVGEVLVCLVLVAQEEIQVAGRPKVVLGVVVAEIFRVPGSGEVPWVDLEHF
jgi:hypothetical protein